MNYRVDIEQLLSSLQSSNDFQSTVIDPRKIYFELNRQYKLSNSSTEFVIPQHANFVNISSIQFDENPLSYTVGYQLYPGIKTAGYVDVPLKTKWFPILNNTSLIIDINNGNSYPRTVRMNYAFCHSSVRQKIVQCKEFSTNLKTYPVLLWDNEEDE